MNARITKTHAPLWCCIHWPLIALDARELSHHPHPTAISEQIKRKALLVSVNTAARAQGLHPNRPLALAKALCPSLEHQPLDNARIERHLQRHYPALYQFTPHLHNLRAHDVALELSGSLKLFKGAKALYQHLQQTLNDLGYAYQLAFAPSAGAAQVLARTQADQGPFYQPEHLHALPLHTLLMDTHVFSNAGFTTIGDILSLPNISRTIRLSKDDEAYLQELIHTPRQWFMPQQPMRYTHTFEPEIESLTPVCNWLTQHLPHLSKTLRNQQQGVQHLELTFKDRQRRETSHTISLTQPTCDHDAMLRVMHSFLDTLTLDEPLERVTLTVYDLYPLVPVHADLFDPEQRGTCQHIDELFDILRTRLGPDRVQPLHTRDDYRPEKTQQTGHHSSESASHLPKPTWLLPSPKRLTATNNTPHWKGPLQLLHGPERIQSGWWDQQPVARDYYIAQHPLGSWLWVYYNHQDYAWYLHGYFA